MEGTPGSKFSLDSLISSVLPSIDAGSPVVDASTKFRRTRASERAAPPVATQSATTPKQPNIKSTPQIPADVAAAAAAAFEALAPGSGYVAMNTPYTASTGTEVTSLPKTKKRKFQKGGGKGGSQHGARETTNTGSSNAQDKDATPNKLNRKRKKNQHTGNQANTQHHHQQKHQQKHQQNSGPSNLPNKTRRRFMERFKPDLDANADAVGVRPDEDFTDLLVQHMAHTTKELEENVKQQGRLMQEQLKQSSAQLADSQGDNCTFKHDIEAREAYLAQEQEMRKTRGVCKYEITGSCTKGDLCPYTHDLSLQPCSFYHLYGVCDKGAMCRFGHTPITPEQFQQLAESRNKGPQAAL
ncbi:hypothetical protein BGZ54_006489 [Gamsiella multidivaricata]|nr:hypothetical protein BGZ54_006489 [Gamsiella multidivaricata]